MSTKNLILSTSYDAGTGIVGLHKTQKQYICHDTI